MSSRSPARARPRCRRSLRTRDLRVVPAPLAQARRYRRRRPARRHQQRVRGAAGAEEAEQDAGAGERDPPPCGGVFRPGDLPVWPAGRCAVSPDLRDCRSGSVKGSAGGTPKAPLDGFWPPRTMTGAGARPSSRGSGGGERLVFGSPMLPVFAPADRRDIDVKIGIFAGSNLPMFINVTHGTAANRVNRKGCVAAGCTTAVNCPPRAAGEGGRSGGRLRVRVRTVRHRPVLLPRRLGLAVGVQPGPVAGGPRRRVQEGRAVRLLIRR
jgi:hypothetical protein